MAQQDQPVDPDAIEALHAMVDALRALETFTVEAELVFEEVQEGGEKILVIEQVTADVAKPHGLVLRTSMPERERVFYFDGETVSVWGPGTRFYASAPFEGTIAEMIVAAAERYGYEVPLSDLFLWGHEDADYEALTQASVIGTARIGGRVCTQYAMRQENVDWQVWIDTAEPKLPCRYAIVSLEDEARPLFQASVEITPKADLSDHRFTFAPPADAERIEFMTNSAGE